MTVDQVTGLLRAILAAVGGFILAKGWISSDMWNWIMGGVISIGPMIWSFIANRPAAIAASAQALPGVSVNASASSGAAPAVVAAVAAAK